MNKGIHRSVSAAGFVRRQRGVSVSLIPRTERSILGSSSHKLKWVRVSGQWPPLSNRPDPTHSSAFFNFKFLLRRGS